MLGNELLRRDDVCWKGRPSAEGNGQWSGLNLLPEDEFHRVHWKWRPSMCCSVLLHTFEIEGDREFEGKYICQRNGQIRLDGK